MLGCTRPLSLAPRVYFTCGLIFCRNQRLLTVQFPSSVFLQDSCTTLLHNDLGYILFVFFPTGWPVEPLGNCTISVLQNLECSRPFILKEKRKGIFLIAQSFQRGSTNLGHYKLKLTIIINTNQIKCSGWILRKGETGVPGENLLGAEQRTNKLNPHIMLSLEIEPGPHWWEASGLTPVPSLHPWSRISLVTNSSQFCSSDALLIGESGWLVMTNCKHPKLPPGAQLRLEQCWNVGKG